MLLKNPETPVWFQDYIKSLGFSKSPLEVFYDTVTVLHNKQFQYAAKLLTLQLGRATMDRLGEDKYLCKLVSWQLAKTASLGGVLTIFDIGIPPQKGDMISVGDSKIKKRILKVYNDGTYYVLEVSGGAHPLAMGSYIQLLQETITVGGLR